MRAADFSVQSCEPVTLQIISGPGADFSTPLGATDTLDYSASNASRPAKIWIGYTATNDGDTASGSVTIQWVETGQQWVIPITANTITRPTVVVELVLDQSGSMDWSSGIAELPKRVDVLKASVPPLLEVIQPENAIGVVSFDHDAYDVMPVTVAGVPVFGAGRGGNGKPPSSNDDPQKGEQDICELLKCLLSKATISPKAEVLLKQLGIDLKQLRRCLDKLCDRRARPELKTNLSSAQFAEINTPEFATQLRGLLAALDG